MEKHIIRLLPLGKELKVNDRIPLIDVLHEYGIEFPCGGKGTCGKCRIRLLDGEIETTEVHQCKLDQLELSSDWRLACLSFCTGPLILEVEQFNHLILADESEFEFEPEDGFGISVDLGTTTLVTQLIDLRDAKVLAVETKLNPQVKYGADLISRIQACLGGHAVELTHSIRKAVGEMIGEMLRKCQVCPGKIVIVGNTVMQLIFSGRDVSPLSAYPFFVDDLDLKIFRARDLGWKLPCSCKIQFMPSIGSFVGSDILAGIAATGIHKRRQYTALVDLGTNGEIVVGNNEHIVCASTAAGPAFEGASISMGMRAVTGAISSLSLEAGKIKSTVIGNTAPKGICGSALIDAIAILRKLDMIGVFGEINSGEEDINIAGRVRLTRKDINEFQLAKAAISTGLKILTQELSIGLKEVDEVYIAGGFGNYINVRHVVETGMIPMTGEKIHKMGNTALIGAKMFLFKDFEEIEEMIKNIRHVNLEGNADFQDIYTEEMTFLTQAGVASDTPRELNRNIF